MGNYFIKVYNNYFKLIDENCELVVLTSGSIDYSSSIDSASIHNVISYNYLSQSVDKYNGIRDSFISSSDTSSEAPLIISESLWEEKKEELKSYIINSI
jgi:hypothetical protein|tara:strand:+ start:885 stop:1181 length:297 start_codon:yes stop_codon:yes gene_type:complete